MQHEQLTLPFEDEVLVIQYESDIEPVDTAYWPYPSVNEETMNLLHKAVFRAHDLGFRVVRTRWTDEYRGRTLHTQLRAEAERA